MKDMATLKKIGCIALFIGVILVSIEIPIGVLLFILGLVFLLYDSNITLEQKKAQDRAKMKLYELVLDVQEIKKNPDDQEKIVDNIINKIKDLDRDYIETSSVYNAQTKPISLDEEVIKILQNVPGMTPADPSDFNKSMKFARLRDNTTIRTWKNLAGVDHVFVEKGRRCIYAGYVGWIHSEGLQQVLNQIKRKFS